MKKGIVLILFLGSFFSFSQPLNIYVINNSAVDVDFQMTSVSSCSGAGLATTPWISLAAFGGNSSITPIGLASDFWLAGVARNPTFYAEFYRVMSICDCDMSDLDAWSVTVAVTWSLDTANDCVLIEIEDGL